jgi:hypothetical protein
MNIEEFKNFVKKENPFKLDNIDMEHGRMTIHRCNINKYLEEYACKNEEDLNDTLWYSYGCLVKIID